MEAFFKAVEREAPALRTLTAKRLAGLGPERPQERASVSANGPIDILWGWNAIASALGVDTKTAKVLAAQSEHPLPVWTGAKKAVQSTRAALQDWADKRAWALTAADDDPSRKDELAP